MVCRYVIMINILIMGVGALFMTDGVGAQIVDSIDHVFTLIFIGEVARAPWNLDPSRHVLIRSFRRARDGCGVSTRLLDRFVSPHSTR